MKDLYKILHVPKTATDERIKKAYRKLSMKYHPDRNSGDPKSAEKFKEVQEAFDVLGDPKKREYYDRTGEILKSKPEGSDLAEIIPLLDGCLTALLADLGEAHKPVDSENIPKTIQEMFEVRIANFEKLLPNIRKGITTMKRAAELFVVEPGEENLLKDICLRKVKMLEQELEGVLKSIEVHKRCWDYLKKVRYMHTGFGGSFASNTLSSLRTRYLPKSFGEY